MLSLGGMEILVILVVALLALGPDKLPNFMRTVGKAMGELRRASTEFQRTIHTEAARGEALLAKTVSASEDTNQTREEAAAVPEKTIASQGARKRSLPRASRPMARGVRRAHSPHDIDAGQA